MSKGQKTRPDWCYRQSGVIPWRMKDGVLEILLITNRPGTRWVIPKGIVEPDLSPAESAAKEAWEEAGIKGLLSTQPAGRYDYRKWGGTCRVEVFHMQVMEICDAWPEQDIRYREWLAPDTATGRIAEPELRDMLLALKENLLPSRSALKGISGTGSA